MCHTQGSPFWFYVVSWPGKLSLLEDSLVLESIEAKRVLSLWHVWRECLRLAFNFIISLCESHLDQIWSQGLLWLYLRRFYSVYYTLHNKSLVSFEIVRQKTLRSVTWSAWIISVLLSFSCIVVVVCVCLFVCVHVSGMWRAEANVSCSPPSLCALF